MADTKQHDENLVGTIGDADEFYLEQKPVADWLPFRSTFLKLWTYIQTKLSTNLVIDVTVSEFNDLVVAALGETLKPGFTYQITDPNNIDNCPIGLDRIFIKATEIGTYDANMSGYINGTTPVRLNWDIITNTIGFCENTILSIVVTETTSGNAMSKIDFESTKFKNSTLPDFSFLGETGTVTASLSDMSGCKLGYGCSLDFSSFTNVAFSNMRGGAQTTFTAMENDANADGCSFGFYNSVTFGSAVNQHQVYDVRSGADCIIDCTDGAVSGCLLGYNKTVIPLSPQYTKTWVDATSTFEEEFDCTDVMPGQDMDLSLLGHAGIVRLLKTDGVLVSTFTGWESHHVKKRIFINHDRTVDGGTMSWEQDGSILVEGTVPVAFQKNNRIDFVEIERCEIGWSYGGAFTTIHRLVYHEYPLAI